MDNFSFTPLNGGRFISRGKGRHAVRTIDSDEIIFVVKGTLTMFEETRFFDLHAGDYLLLRRGKRHGGILDYPPGLSFFWLHFNSNGDFPENMPPSGHAARPEQLAIYFQSFLAEQQEQFPDEKNKSLLLELILRELTRPGTLSPVHQFSTLARRAGELIKLRFADHTLSLNSAAGILHCNTEYLGKIFHLHYHETFTSQLNRTRVEYAAKLLTESNNSIKEIIFECGFNDPAYFRRIFFRRFSATPTAFRKFHRNGKINT
ncbi:MAG: helix-turn-helix domain-containing protein [Lentisphaeria bacterium]|nr:helix-turn-helix domain-containing protein [Lentisphaeria bacterium]